jgi:metal-sulfur cluster biosynthetic enzyme
MRTKQDVINAISEVQHPAIAYSLLELGIVKDVELDKNTARVIFAFPFPNIPIADHLINSIYTPVNALGLEFQYAVTVMTEEEKARFMHMEAEAWRG